MGLVIKGQNKLKKIYVYTCLARPPLYIGRVLTLKSPVIYTYFLLYLLVATRLVHKINVS